jgi:hypothetical protein
MPAPFEIIAGAADVYLAAPNTADVVLNVAPGGSWTKLGVAGSKDYSEDGVMCAYEQDQEDFYGLGATGPRKAFRTRERLKITFTLHDATVESFTHAFNEAAITTLAGPPAEKTIPLIQGGTVQTRALLIRSAVSPYVDSANPTQLWVPLCYQKGSFDIVFNKGKPIGLKLDFFALQDDTNGFGKLHEPTA